MTPVKRRWLIAILAIIAIAWFGKTVFWDSFITLRNNPQTLFVKVEPGSWPVEVFLLDNGETLYLPFDGTIVSQARSQVYVGSHDDYWVKVFKNGRLKDDIRGQWRFPIATGDYRLEVRERGTDQLISTVYIKAYFTKDEPDMTDIPSLQTAGGFIYPKQKTLSNIDRVFNLYGGVCLKKSEPILRRIPMNKTETMRTRQGKLFFWGFGFALPRLISRPQEGSGEECGRVSEFAFFQNRRNSGQ